MFKQPELCTVEDLVPCSHDTGSRSRFRDIARLPLNKGKTQFCHISNKKPASGVKGLSLDDWEKGQQHRELGFVLPLPIVWCSRSPGPPCLWDGQRRDYSHAAWTCHHLAALVLSVTRASPGVTNCLGFLSLEWKIQWCSPFYPLKRLLSQY